MTEVRPSAESGGTNQGEGPIPRTEDRHPDTRQLDRMETLQALRLFNREDHRAAQAVEKALPQIARVVDAIADRMKRGGKLIYVGTGTSGRLGVLDAVECPPTFGTPPKRVQAVLAGGNEACYESKEGVEDDPQRGASDLRRRRFTAKDSIVGITASGATLYTLGALRYALRRKALTVALTCNADSEAAQITDMAIEVITGPEVLAGSTRLKAATAQKMVLNMISTMAMARLGHVYTNLMINIRPSNRKLSKRATDVVSQILDIPASEAEACLERAEGEIPTALVMARLGCGRRQAAEKLAEAGSLRAALGEA